jgi:hypothetical protein
MTAFSRRRAVALLLSVATVATTPVHADDDVPLPPEAQIVPPVPGTGVGSEMVRVTSSFEVTHAAAVLRQVAKLFSAGFGRRDAEQVASLIDALSAEQSRSWDFSGVRKGVTYPLRVRARIDEFGTLDLDLFAPPPLAAQVREAVDGYLNARGL